MVRSIAVVSVVFLGAVACASSTQQQPASSAPAAAMSHSASQLSPTTAVDPATAQRLWALANAAATSAESAVKIAEAVRTTRAPAVLLTSQGIIVDDQPVWLVQVEATTEFVCDRCSRPVGAAAPHGRYQTLIVAASTFEHLDSGIDATAANLSSLGTVIDLHP